TSAVPRNTTASGTTLPRAAVSRRNIEVCVPRTPDLRGPAEHHGLRDDAPAGGGLPRDIDVFGPAEHPTSAVPRNTPASRTPLPRAAVSRGTATSAVPRTPDLPACRGTPRRAVVGTKDGAPVGGSLARDIDVCGPAEHPASALLRKHHDLRSSDVRT